MRRYVNEIFNKEYIKLNTFSYTAAIFIIKKSNKKFQIYIDYRAFNALIIKNYNALFLIKKTLTKLYTIKIFNKFVLITIFNEIRIKKKKEKKTVFLI